jgi:hypothetical protein
MNRSKKLLAIDTNAKTVKGQKYGFMTGILYMAPSTLAGPNVCPMATIAGCEKACLYSAGRGAFNSVQQSRIDKAKWFHADRESFMVQVVRNIEGLIKKAKANDMTPLVRLNGTSDIRWESIPVTHNGATYANVMALFPQVQFYDYTKIANRKDVPSNYDLTFSYSGTLAYQKYVTQAKAAGMRIAAVFRNVEDIPATFLALDCVDGDDSDIRHMDPQGVVVALYAKGAAKHDTTGFVVDTVKGQARRVIPVSLAS